MTKVLQTVILESENFSEAALNILQSISSVNLNHITTIAQAQNVVKDADIILCRLRLKIDSMIIDHAPKLKIVATPTTGTDHIDTDYLAKKNISFISLKGERQFLDNIYATAEHTIALTLSLLRNIPSATASVRQGIWNRDLFRGQELEGKTVGIIGLGRLGTKTAHYFNAFGCRVVANDIKNVACPSYVTMLHLEQLLAESDIISLHIDYNAQNHHFMNKSNFSLMKKGAFFINTARGSCIDELALYNALLSENIAGAALDVMAGELDNSFLKSPLFSYIANHHNLIITPHIGGATRESMAKTEIFIAEKIKNQLRNIKTFD